MNVDRRPSPPVGQPPGGTGGAPRKPTRAECIRQAAPHLAQLVLARRAQARAQAADGPPPAAPPTAA